MARGKSITKEMVAQKAVEIARRDGIDQVSYNQLAREIGIRPQSMYRYVENIREVHVIILRTFLNEMIDALQKSLEKKEPLDALRTFSAELYDLTSQNPWYCECLDVIHKYTILEELEDQLNGLTALIEKPIEELKPQEVRRYTQLFMAVIIGFTHMRFSHFPASNLRYDRESYIRSMNEFIEKIFAPAENI